MPLDGIEGLAPARDVLFGALAAAIRPKPKLRVSEWAGKYRVVSAESGSRYPGKWRNDRAPHLVEIMDAFGPDDPCEDVVFAASAQVGKSETGINVFGYVAHYQPGPAIIVLPSFDEMKKYVRQKLQPAIDESPVLRARVLESASKGESGSTASFKKFRGGFAQITFAGSSKGLQMLSARYTLGDEVTEWPAAAGERGDPVDQLKTRTRIFERDRKRGWFSTPGLAGTCRITADYEKSDMRRRYAPCPHCGAYHVLKFENLKYRSEEWPHRAYLECPANGCVIEHSEKPAMLANAEWIVTAGDEPPGDWFPAEELEKWRSYTISTRIRGFHIWQAYSLFASWDSIIADWLAAKGNSEKMRVFTQQVLAEPFEDKGEAPDAEMLFKARVVKHELGAPPPGPVVFTGATDVQGNRLEWAVWGWGPGMQRWLVDKGVIEGDPHDREVWAQHDLLLERCKYDLGGVRPVAVEAWAVDSGYASQHVYNYTRGRHGLFAIDGRDGRNEPFIGSPKKVDVKLNGKRVKGGAVIWPVGTFGLKSDLYSAVRKAIAGRNDAGAWPDGSMILPGDIDLAYAEQLTSEHLVTKEAKSGVLTKAWQKLQGRPNEALDIACYARAMAFYLRLDRLTPDEWRALQRERAPEKDEAAQADLFPTRVTPASEQSQRDTSRENKRGKSTGGTWLGGRERNWNGNA